MNTMEALLTRRSCRAYKPDMIPHDVLEKIVEAGTYAPTGVGRQAPVILAVTNKELRDRLSRMNAAVMGQENVDPFYGAPVVLVVLADKSICGTWQYDGSLVMGNLMLAAHELGVASCWIHRAREEFESEEGKAILAKYGMTGDLVGIGHCVLGYAAKEPNAPAKRKENYVTWAE